MSMYESGGTNGGVHHPEGEVLLIAVDRRIAAYLQYLVARDLASWPPSRTSRLQPEDVTPWVLYLRDLLPEPMRTPVPPLPREGRRPPSQ